MHVLQSRIVLIECFVRPSFLNFRIPDDTDKALITTQMIVKAAKYMHITKCVHILCMELLLSTFQCKNIRVRGPFSCLYYTYHRLSPRKEPLFVVGRMGREKKNARGGTPICSYMKGGGMLVGNFELQPLNETNLGVVQPFFDP